MLITISLRGGARLQLFRYAGNISKIHLKWGILVGIEERRILPLYLLKYELGEGEAGQWMQSKLGTNLAILLHTRVPHSRIMYYTFPESRKRGLWVSPQRNDKCFRVRGMLITLR